MFSNYIKKILVFTIFAINLLYSTSSTATVVMTGNRIIYPADTKEKILQFSNPDDIPYMVQIWTDINNPNSKPQTADGPFIATPQLFRIEPHNGQAVRLVFNNKKALPNDRESIFYFNFLQIPGLNNETKEKNKLVLLVTNRLKIFYRPKNLNPPPQEMTKKIYFKLKNNELEVTNDSPYYATFDKVDLLDANQKIVATIKDPTMLAPKSKDNWFIKSNITEKPIIVQYSLINDFGVSISYKHQL